MAVEGVVVGFVVLRRRRLACELALRDLPQLEDVVTVSSRTKDSLGLPGRSELMARAHRVRPRPESDDPRLVARSRSGDGDLGRGK